MRNVRWVVLLTEVEKAAFTDAASSRGEALGPWMRRACRELAEREAPPAVKRPPGRPRQMVDPARWAQMSEHERELYRKQWPGRAPSE